VGVGGAGGLILPGSIVRADDGNDNERLSLGMGSASFPTLGATIGGGTVLLEASSLLLRRGRISASSCNSIPL